MPYEEQLLLKEASVGSEKAFRTLYDAYFNRLSAYIFKFFKSSVATEEIIQEVFLKIWVHRTELAEVENFQAYILFITRNKTIDHLRRLARESSLMKELADRLQTNSNPVEHEMNSADIKTLIAGALAELSPQKGKIFHLSKNEGLGPDEISRVMQLSKSTVKNHLSETLRHIRRYLDLSGIKKI
ncbi:MAG: RNA polymerase sigma-70 factor [Chitinophagaceae bacterium]|nr:RNA polymerase sigma-70 factor [Chitinophagaceae bacterium]